MVKIWILLLCCLIGGGAAAADVEVRIDPDPPLADESFDLVFIVRGQLDADPDFAPIESMLEIVGRSRQTSIQSINGNYTRVAQWVLNVIPKRSGPIELPAIAFGRAHSPARRIVPVARADAAGKPDDSLFMEVDATPRVPYVQQQVIYTLRLWRRLEISNASLSTPELSVDTIVKSLGDDRHYEAERDGLRYDVVERRFALFPQASGAVTIAPAVVTAQVVHRKRSVFDNFGQSLVTRRISSEPIALEVKPIPAAFPGGTWLPAVRLRLHEEWDPAALTVPAGEPVTRTVFVWADGLTAGQLPAFTAPAVQGVKSYPDQPQMKDEPLPSGVTAVRQDKVALIPAAGGRIELPAIELPWWNTATDTLEIARLPARALTVEAPAVAAAAPPPEPAAAAAVRLPAAPATAPRTPREIPLAAWRGWIWVALASVFGWAATTIALLRRRPAARAVAPSPAAPAPGPALRRLKAACAGQDAGGTRDALLAWARERWPEQPPLTLGGVGERLPRAARQELDRLGAALYAGRARDWDGAALWAALDGAERTTRAPATAPGEVLPKLFKLTA